MACDTFEEEISLLESIYCMNNEFVRLHTNEIRLKFDDLEINVVFQENRRPNFRTSHPNLTRNCEQELNRSINIDKFDSVYDSVQFIRNYVQENCRPNDNTDDVKREENQLALLMHLDHMRNTKDYLKTLKSWCYDLGLY